MPATVTNVVSLASGGDHSLALLANGTVVAWGDNSYQQNSLPVFANPVVAIAEGTTHSLALESDGTVVAWGDNSLGETNISFPPNVVAIAAGTGFSHALLPDGSIFQWPPGYAGGFTNVMLLSTKGTHTLALCGDGTMVETGLGSV